MKHGELLRKIVTDLETLYEAPLPSWEVVSVRAILGALVLLVNEVDTIREQLPKEPQKEDQ